MSAIAAACPEISNAYAVVEPTKPVPTIATRGIRIRFRSCCLGALTSVASRVESCTATSIDFDLVPSVRLNQRLDRPKILRLWRSSATAFHPMPALDGNWRQITKQPTRAVARAGCEIHL